VFLKAAEYDAKRTAKLPGFVLRISTFVVELSGTDLANGIWSEKDNYFARNGLITSPF
jgi:hypothetical protein